ncbi:MAG: S9 family peptidase [Saprospiraceae bacterium]|nr:S9 family peptidase [Saprospiraceae bacterium]
MKNFLLFMAAFIAVTQMSEAQKLITLEDIFEYNTYNMKSVSGFNFMNDGKHYTRLEGSKIQQYDLTTGNRVQTIFDAVIINNAPNYNNRIESYTFSADEQKILIFSDQERVYRRSTKDLAFVYDRQTKALEAVSSLGKISLATFNPQADKVAFVFENNLYIKDLASDKILQITNDGKKNAIINGGMDWVYEEEFALTTGFQWSPDGQHLAFYRFDESEVKEYTMDLYHNDLYPEYKTFKYPKVGEKNSIVTIHIYDINSGKIIKADTGNDTDIYIPRIRWTSNPNQLCVFRLNRHQNKLELLLTDANNGETKIFFSEENKYYIEEATLDDFTFLHNKEEFLFTSERDGWRHIYIGFINSKKILQITKGNWEVSNLYGIDEKNGIIFYQAAEKSPLERQVYAIGLDGKNKKVLADTKGNNGAQFSSTYDYYVITHSTINSPNTYAVYDRNGKQIRVIEDNADLKAKMKEYQTQAVEFFQFKTSENVELNGWMLKPRGFQANRRYPVFMFVYGGPGSQQVTDAWKGNNYWYFQMLAQQGYLVACVDNRGTGGRGEAFKKMTYLQLGKYETIDQIEAAKWLGKQSYVDPDRIGIYGWSYGGYMASLCILRGNDTFRAAVAGAPVTNWKWYDSIYTERFMQSEKENAEGYRDNSPVNFADRLKGDLLLVHGLADDNVHFQHTAEMANALIKAGKQFDTYFYPNQAHGFNSSARLHFHKKMTRFLDEHLKGTDVELTPTKAPKKVELIEEKH